MMNSIRKKIGMRVSEEEVLSILSGWRQLRILDSEPNSGRSVILEL